MVSVSAAIPPPRVPLSPSLLTLTLLLTHDGVTEGQQAEKLVGVRVSHLHRLQKGVIIETEVRICQGVERSEVQSLKTHEGSGAPSRSTYIHIMFMDACECVFDLWLRSQWVRYFTCQ